MEIIVLWIICVFIVDFSSLAIKASPLDSKIREGSIIEDERVPYVVAFKKDRRIVCTGSLLSDEYVLSTFECALRIRKLLNSDNVNSTMAFIEEEKYEIARIIFSSHIKTGKHYLGLIKLTPVFDSLRQRLNEFAIPIAITPINIVNKIATVFGYGRKTNRCRIYTMRKMEIEIKNETFCKESFKDRWGGFVAGKQMCGTASNHLQEIELEDSGNPLIYDHCLVGIITYKRKVRQQIPPITIARIDNLEKYFPELKIVSIAENQ